MRVGPLVSFAVGVRLSRTYRAETVEIGWYVRLLRLPVPDTRCVQVDPSVLVWMLNAPVFHDVVSPPRPACLITNELMFWFDPRSTWRNFVPAADEHHLLSTPSTPSNALAGPSVLAHAADPVAGLFRARLVPRFGAVDGGAIPSVKDGGTSPAPVPHELAAEPIVYDNVAPAAMLA